MILDRLFFCSRGKKEIHQNLIYQTGRNTKNDVSQKEDGGRPENRNLIGNFYRILENRPNKRKQKHEQTINQIRLGTADDFPFAKKPGAEQGNGNNWE